MNPEQARCAYDAGNGDETDANDGLFSRILIMNSARSR
jgi:hypothetical protein